MNPADTRTLAEIVRRATTLVELDPLTLMTDLRTAHLRCPLALRELLAADDTDFLHDVLGITAHINRRTGDLADGFVPRFAAVFHA